MALLPKIFKYKKKMRSPISTSISTRKKRGLGAFSIIATSAARVTDRELSAFRKNQKKQIKPYGGRIKCTSKLTVPVSGKSMGSRMGRGKGKVQFHSCFIKEGNIVFNIYCKDYEKATQAIAKSNFKLSFPTIIGLRAKCF